MKLIFLGSQGSGKSTQASTLSQKLVLPYIEMGQLMRDKAQEAGEVREALEKGDLVPDNIAVVTLKERLAKSDCKNGYILDGYPRNYAQLEGIESDIDKVFFIKVSDQEGIKRLIDRARHDDTLETITRRLELYHQQTEPLLLYFKQKGILEEIDGQRNIDEVHQDIINRLQNGNTNRV